MSDINNDIARTMLSAAHELSEYIADANQELRRKVYSQTESDPDWHDTQTCYELAQDAKRVIAMQARIVELEKALSNIKKHQEAVIVGMPQLSTTWQIASRALEK